jgi:ribose transport system ATP-binding protein
MGPMAMLGRRAMAQKAAELLDRVGLSLPPSMLVSRLTAGQMQMVEIAKALGANARAIIMDEPTSSLTAGESEHLFKIIGQLKSVGIAIIYISHRMEEVLKLSDRITILRDGCYVGDVPARGATHDKIVSMMVGRSFTTRFPDRRAEVDPAKKAPSLVVEDLLVPGAIHAVSFKAYAGEILGFAGLVGSGRTELMQVLFGVDPALGGRMLLNGKPYRPRSAHDAIAAGVYLVPEDRKRHGLVLPMTVAENISLPDVGNYRPRGFLHRGREREEAIKQVASMRIKTPDVYRKVVNLSGGNQQKVVIGKWLAMKPNVLIMDEPTRGIDVGAKAEIYHTMAALAERGLTILIVSSDMEEVIGISDRIVVMHERKIRGILPRSAATQERIGMLMTGRDAELISAVAHAAV